MKWVLGTVWMLMAVVITNAGVSFRYTGTVTDADGQPLAGALVSVSASSTIVAADADGNYVVEGEIEESAVKIPHRKDVAFARIVDGTIRLSLPQALTVGVAVYRLNGTRVSDIPQQQYPAGEHALTLSGGRLPSSSYLVKISTGTMTQVVPMVLAGHTGSIGVHRQAVALGGGASAQRSATVAMPLIRASAAGYQSDDTLSTEFSGTYDFTLEELAPRSTGTAGQEDGSLDRMVYHGKEQFFWGDPDETGKDIPMVKIVTAVSEDAVDIALIFNPGFVDNTYGTGKVGWKKHTFEQLVKSDHVALSVRNGDSVEVFAGKIDMITPSSDAPSGYGTLGLYGGDGEISNGSGEHVLSFGTSMDDNLNYYGYELFENSPETDETYAQNPEYPHWEYYAIYRISFDPALFGVSGYGDVQMTSVHASPAKTNSETVTVTEKGPPNDSDDPFTHTSFGEPPVDMGDPDRPPPSDTTDGDGNPPGDTTDGDGNPPGDTTDGDGNPPGDTTDTTEDRPPDDVME